MVNNISQFKSKGTELIHTAKEGQIERIQTGLISHRYPSPPTGLKPCFSDQSFPDNNLQVCF